MQRLTSRVFLVILILACSGVGYTQKHDSKAKDHTLRVYVCDEDGNILTGIVLCSKGKGVPSEPTDITGRTEIVLSDDATPGESIDLILIQEVKANQDWEIVPGARILIHAFNDKPNTFSTVPLRRKAVRRESDALSSQSKLAATLRGEFADATGDLMEALQKKQGELVIIYIQLGHTYYDQKKYLDALRAYNTALDNSPDDDEILYHMTLALAQLDRYPEALSKIERCLQIRKARPESIDLAITYETYASLLVNVNRKAESMENLAAARALRARLSRWGRKQ